MGPSMLTRRRHQLPREEGGPPKVESHRLERKCPDAHEGDGVDQFSPVATSENFTLSRVPIAVAPVTMRMLTKPAMKQYSIAVAPDGSRRKRRITARMTNPQRAAEITACFVAEELSSAMEMRGSSTSPGSSSTEPDDLSGQLCPRRDRTPIEVA